MISKEAYQLALKNYSVNQNKVTFDVLNIAVNGLNKQGFGTCNTVSS